MANKNVEVMRGNPETAVKKLAIPIMISMLLTASYNIIDGIWIAGLGQEAIAGIGFITPIFMILNGVSVGLGSGATSSISRFVGAKNHKKASQSAAHSLLIFLIASVVLTIVLLILQEPLLKLYGASGESLAQGIKYGTPLFLGLFAFIFANGASGILRGEGDMKRAMYAVVVSVILNAILDPICIYILGWGSAGAAIATILSSICSAIVILYWILVKKDTYVDVNLGEFKFDSSIAKDILKVGIPASMDMLVMAIAMSLYMIFISSIAGEFGIASFTSGQRLYLFAIMPLTAIGTAVTAVVGSSFGAKNGEYISRAHKFGAKFGIIFGTCVTLILVVFATQLSTIFAYTAETAHLVPEITRYLQIACLCLPLTGAGMASSFFYQGIGKGTISLSWTIIREVIFTVGATFFFGIYLGWGLIGIWAGLAIGRTTASILNYLYARYTIKGIRETLRN
ncbi:MATE family efflux transporter [Methanobrevibacter smithii]|uniref:MATE family efflux transporter n=1 Tax=Methanobrevibacter smithii TaxID=2173 RepID=UPI001FCB90D0|nr:MATE family efflux transporter [Methanobrevibacter smithii]MBS6826764.1 MATE family efflux transporter [Methanobrevibacter smithii]BDF79877.1 MATE family efflux transporter [Methanobrevibacter smithii]BDF81814.1 MATE family efflux transporter [Methanobrevibacter smithii]